MAHLEPSVELTGGPWYTDNELDTEFIKLLCSACLRYIRERVCRYLFHFLPANLMDPDTPKTQT
jgi:RNA polymerase Rpc34 subunit